MKSERGIFGKTKAWFQLCQDEAFEPSVVERCFALR